jgi:glycosyltransferase
MNKGIKLAKGDIIGILNSDDVFADKNAVSRAVSAIVDQKVDSCYADIVYVDRADTSRVVRNWQAGPYEKKRFRTGWMPPHPTFFVKRSVYEKYGLLNLDFPLAADYELMLRFLYKHEVSTTYIPEVLVKMRAGGTSPPRGRRAGRPGMYTIKSVIENYRAWKVNGLSYPPTMLLKPFSKISQFLRQ